MRLKDLDKKITEQFWVKRVSGKRKISLSDGKVKTLPFITIEQKDLSWFYKISKGNDLAQFTLLTTIYSVFLKRYFEDYDGCITAYINNNPATPLLFDLDVSILNRSLKDKLQELKTEIAATLSFADYEPENIASKIDGRLDQYTPYGISTDNSDSAELCKGLFIAIKTEADMNLRLTISYLEGFADEHLLLHFLNNFRLLLCSLEIYLNTGLLDFPLLNESEKQLLLDGFNDTKADYPKNHTIVSLFEEQVKKTPGNTAVIYAERKLSYKQLNAEINQLANFIAAHYVIKKGQVIGVLMPKSLESIRSLFAIMKLGAVYLPVDPAYPEDRIRQIFKDSEVKLVISINEPSTSLALTATILNLSEVSFIDYQDENLNKDILNTDPAYLIYTSGSTGTPKGVLIRHGSNINMSLDQIKTFSITETDGVLWFASVSFDASISEIMMAAYSGAKLIIPEEKTIKDVKQFTRFIQTSETTVVTFTPGYLNLISVTDLTDLRCIITAGEVISSVKAMEIALTGIDCFNAYGPTEYAVCATIYNFNLLLENSAVPIGKPIANTAVYILDENLQLLPLGARGKIYLAGDGLAIGYYKNESLSAEKFIANPFVPGTRMYDTGDLGLWLPDGNLQFAGRSDHQVKIRGYRIEPGEIENVLLEYLEPESQVIVEVIVFNSEKVLVAYIVSAAQLDRSALKTYLQQKLPEYMVPAFYVQLAAMPLTPNGKTDRKALPGIGQEDMLHNLYQAPANETEQQLTAIWQEVLGIERIGVTDNFFDLGGHSLIVSQVINRTHKRFGKTISFSSFLSNPTIEGISRQFHVRDYQAIPKAADASGYPLSSSQSRIWLLSQLSGGSQAYHMPAALRLTGPLNPVVLEASFARLMERHEILRTYFKENAQGEVLQYVVPWSALNFKLKIKDLSAQAGMQGTDRQGNADTDLLVAAYLVQSNQEPFELSTAPLLRAELLKLNAEEHVFFLNIHHIAGDGWSMGILINEVIRIYNGLINGKEIRLPELAIQYKDYALWHNQEIRKPAYLASEAYWLSRFQGDLPVIDLPGFKTRSAVQTYRGDSVVHHYPAVFLEKLKHFSSSHGATVFMTLMTGITALLHRYTGQDDLVIGTPIAGRVHPDLENQIGLYLNTLAIRSGIADNSSFSALLDQQKENLAAAYEHQYYPFDLLVSKLKLKRDIGRSALFDVMVVLHNQQQLNSYGQTALIDELKITTHNFKDATAKIDLSFEFAESHSELQSESQPQPQSDSASEGLELTIKYNTDNYEGVWVSRIFAHLENLLTKAMDYPDIPITAIDYLPENETHQLVVEFNETETTYAKEKTIVDLFQEQVKRVPNHIAVYDENREYSYSGFDKITDHIAAFFVQNSNAQDKSAIGVLMNRSAAMLAVLLGILKAGRAYVPLDPDFPRNRLDFIIKNSGIKNLVAEKRHSFQEIGGLFSIDPEDLLEGALLSGNKPSVEISSTDTAYVIYTSGSTGVPKGVEISHQSLTNVLLSVGEKLKINPADQLFSVTTYSFDVSVVDFFLPIINGASLYIASAEILSDPELIIHKLAVLQPTVLQATPAFYQMLFKAGWTGSNQLKIVCGGDLLQEKLAEKLIAHCLEAWHLYGPTETTIWSTGKKLKTASEHLHIGKPIANTAVYILDDNLKLLPLGARGKIYLAGDGLAIGYYKNESLSAEKFITNPFVPGTRMYDTGDLGLWLPDGNLQFAGRSDHQVKIRGYRIEPGEIENVLLEYLEAESQVIVEVIVFNSEKVLVAYIVSAAQLDRSALKTYLQQKLPEYMVPAFYVQLAAMPLTPNGKTDRKALPGIGQEDMLHNLYQAPANETEQQLTAIWQEVLGIERIGVTDNFFDLGGHSLIVSQVINRTHKRFGKTISFSSFLSNPTIEGISRQFHVRDYQAIPKAADASGYPLSSSQSRIWLLSQLSGGSQAYHMPAALRLSGPLNPVVLEASFARLMERHEILRTYFKENEQREVLQHVVPWSALNFKLKIKDFSTQADTQDTHTQDNAHTEDNTGTNTNTSINTDLLVAAYLVKSNQEPFELSKAPLLRAELLKLGTEEHVFFLNMHHIAGDGWSMGILIDEVIRIYNGLISGKEIQLPELAIQYKDYALWHNQEIQEPAYLASEAYWLSRFQGDLPVIDLPGFKTRSAVQTYRGDSVVHHYSAVFLEKLKHFSSSHGATVFMTLMAGITALLHRYTGQDDLVIGTPIAGRVHPDLENQIGLYLNTLAIRSGIAENSSFSALLDQQKENLTTAYEHQHYPFDLLVSKLKLKRDIGRSALFDVMVVLHNEQQLSSYGQTDLIDELKITTHNFKNPTAKIDLSFDFAESQLPSKSGLQSQSEGLELTIKYNTDNYDGIWVSRIFTHLENLLTKAMEHPDVPITTIDYLPENETHQLVVEFNQAETEYPEEKTIVDLFQEQADLIPDHIAVVCENGSLTYKELNDKANQLSSYLKRRGAGKDTLVILCFDSHLEMALVGMLGILKSGAAYVPIDVDYPKDRINYIIENTKAEFIVSHSQDFPVLTGISINKILLDQKDWDQETDPMPQILIAPSHPAYVIFTSGSTGLPKGVVINHRNLMDYLFGLASSIPIAKNRTFGLMSTIATDLGNTVLFSSLIFGKTIHLFSKNRLRDTDYIQEYFSTHEIDCIKIVPSYWKSLELKGKFPYPKQLLIFGGETLSTETVKKIYTENPDLIVVNHYGPTETTIGKLLHLIDPKANYDKIPVGKPFSNTQAYVVDTNLALCPVGIAGELVLGGDGISTGYLNNPELTLEKFIPDVFRGDGSKLYRTGDLVVMQPNGDIVFRNRIDDQVKLFGHRIEPGEIEACLIQVPGVEAAIVQLKEAKDGNKKIIAFIVSSGELTHLEIRKYLGNHLPYIMIPSLLIDIDEIPLTSNGKVNRKALPDISWADLAIKNHIAPVTPAEEKLVEIWKEVLQITEVGTNDNFFELGGHSLLALNIVNRINTEFSCAIDVSLFFKMVTLKDLAELISLTNAASAHDLDFDEITI
ncbi:Nonribosomal peptide synthetase [Pedobacter cryoconitis]|uniref:Nonribosomal peptide synthetase n=1 Tax=Pedobacter cryoconitis TaxID=188932 RepID=A0A127VD16_9SPHI|nr:non-ribosomal peptide synthetase [Pedobacter cryoconitis]AMP99120.1 Nonribosomal peptide synthetase [Pedobacter cryoconitis]